MNTKTSISFDGRFIWRDFVLICLLWGCIHLLLYSYTCIGFRRDKTIGDFLQSKYR